MVIVKILGGFASQLRHYGVGYLLAQSKHTELFIDLSDYVEGYFRPFMLNYVSLPDCYILRDKSILNKVINVKNGSQLIELYKRDDFPNVYLGGETSNYSDFFEMYPAQYPGMNFELLRSLKVKNDSQFLDSFKNMIDNEPGIGVHVRLGDFNELGVADNIEKYKAAIGWILTREPSYKVYFFSNDIEATIEMFGNDRRFRFIDYRNGYLGDVEEFFALSMCQEKIIASRSGYSRYASFLGMMQYGANKAICLENVDNLSEEFVFLDENQLNEGTSFYSRKITCDAKNVNIIGKEFVPEIRYDTVCRNSAIEDYDERIAFWKQYYGCDEGIKGRVFVIKSLKKYNRWFFNGLYQKALVLGRVGCHVLYVCKKGNDSFGMETDKIIRAKDMDGNDLGFDIFISEDKINLRDICMTWKYNSNQVICIHDSTMDIAFALVKKISKHHFKDECLSLPNKLSQLTSLNLEERIS